MRNVLIIAAICLASALLAPVSALAVPAMPGIIDVQQPDGTKIKSVIKGDEFQGWVETADGYTIVRNNKSGSWEWADDDGKGGLRSSGIKAGNYLPPPARISRHIKPLRDTERERVQNQRLLRMKNQRVSLPAAGSVTAGSSLSGSSPSGSASPGASLGNWNPSPVSGSKKMLIILVKFANRTSLRTTASGWNSTTFNTTAGAKSLYNYYKDNSFNSLTVTPATTRQSGKPQGIVEVSVAQDHPNCGGNFDYTVERTWVGSAVSQASTFVNFSGMDANKDHVLDESELVVYLIPAGYEASGSAKTPNIWAHAMYDWLGVTADGCTIYNWALNGEMNDAGAQHPMGVITHEMGHAMCGLPDLYDTTYTNSGLGIFSLMASGSWGKTSAESYYGTTPVALDAWCRQYLGWSSPRSTGGTGVTFGPALSATNAPLKLVNPAVSADQYFLVENRYSTGWDNGMEPWLGAGWGGGLLIQHIDESIGSPGSNNINEYVAGNHQGVMIEEASTSHGSLLGNTSDGHVTHMFYSTNNTAFTDSSTPNSKLYNGTSTGISISSISTRSSSMTATVSGQPPQSAITSPSGGSTLHGPSFTITGTATDNSGSGLQKVEVSTNGGASWSDATGTTTWSYVWTLSTDGSSTILSRAKDNLAGTEVPGAGVAVVVDNRGVSELQHYNWNANFTAQGCAVCHNTPNKFLPSDYKIKKGICGSCHNAGGIGHQSLNALNQHPVQKNVSTTWTKKPTYGNITANENDNRPKAHLDGKNIACVTCHNPMKKYEDYGRSWEYTTSSDNQKYWLDRGRWNWIGDYKPKVYRDTTLWAGPTYSKDKRTYLVDPSEYSFNEYSGLVRFNSAQGASIKIYVDLDYPYLRASSKDNTLCLDCHKEATHMGANCLTCHQSHNTTNIKGIRQTIRTPDRQTLPVVFSRVTGANSFADGGSTRDGVCEVCHTITDYYRRDGSGAANHITGNKDKTNCASCHTHLSGFAR